MHLACDNDDLTLQINIHHLISHPIWYFVKLVLMEFNAEISLWSPNLWALIIGILWLHKTSENFFPKLSGKWNRQTRYKGKTLLFLVHSATATQVKSQEMKRSSDFTGHHRAFRQPRRSWGDLWPRQKTRCLNLFHWVKTLQSLLQEWSQFCQKPFVDWVPAKRPPLEQSRSSQGEDRLNLLCLLNL